VRNKDNDYKIFSDKSLENCYWAGLMAADGYVGSSIALGLKEERMIQLFIDFCGLDKVPKWNPSSRYYTATFYSKVVKENLKNNFNIFGKKTFTLLPPDLETDEQEIAFLSGVIDGDGWAIMSKGYPCIGVCGAAPEFMQWIYELVIKYSKSKASLNRTSSVYKVEIKGLPAANLLLNLLSVDIPRMKRKLPKLYSDNTYWERKSVLKCSKEKCIQILKYYLDNDSVDYNDIRSKFNVNKGLICEIVSGRYGNTGGIDKELLEKAQLKARTKSKPRSMTTETALNIYNMCEHTTQRAVAEFFNVNISLVADIRYKKSYKEIHN